MHFCECPMHCKVHWRAQEAGIVQIDFIAAFNWVNHMCILYIVGNVLTIFTQFLSNRSQHVMVNGCRSKLGNIVSGVPQAVF